AIHLGWMIRSLAWHSKPITRPTSWTWWKNCAAAKRAHIPSARRLFSPALRAALPTSWSYSDDPRHTSDDRCGAHARRGAVSTGRRHPGVVHAPGRPKSGRLPPVTRAVLNSD